MEYVLKVWGLFFFSDTNTESKRQRQLRQRKNKDNLQFYQLKIYKLVHVCLRRIYRHLLCIYSDRSINMVKEAEMEGEQEKLQRA